MMNSERIWTKSKMNCSKKQWPCAKTKKAMHAELVAQLKSEKIDTDSLKAMVNDHKNKMEELIDLGIDKLAEFHQTLSAEQREKLVAKLESFKKWHGHDWE